MSQIPRTAPSASMYTVFKKVYHPGHGHNFCQFLIDFQNSFPIAKSIEFPTKPILNYPSNLNCVALLLHLGNVKKSIFRTFGARKICLKQNIYHIIQLVICQMSRKHMQTLTLNCSLFI